MWDFFSLIAFMFVGGSCIYLVLSALGYFIDTYNNWSKNINTVSNLDIQTNAASNFPIFTYIDDNFFDTYPHGSILSYKVLALNYSGIYGYPIILDVPILDELGLDAFNEISLISTRNEYDDMNDIFRDF